MHGADIQQVKLGGGAGGGEVEVTEQLARAAEKQHRASSMLRGQGPEPQQPRAPKAVSETEVGATSADFSISIHVDLFFI